MFDTIFYVGRDDQSALKLICDIFIDLLNVTKSQKDISRLSDIINVWMVRYPSDYKIKFLSRWFVLCCVQVTYVKESELIERGKGQSRLWSIMKHLTVERTDQMTVTLIINEICNVILTVESHIASEAYDLVKKAFVEDSQEYTLFAKIYADKAIQKRISEAKV